MFLLTRQDVEILPISQGQQVLRYHAYTFRLVKVFGDQKKEALVYWREMIDDKGMVCILLEEPQRYSVWAQIDRAAKVSEPNSVFDLPRSLIQGSLVLLKSAFKQAEQNLGTRKTKSLQQELLKVLLKSRLPIINSPEAIANLIQLDPFNKDTLPTWDDSHVQNLLGELHRLLLASNGNEKTQTIVEQSLESLNMLPSEVSISFEQWLKTTPKGKLWSKK
jgi:hypothetical protein